MSRLFTEEFVRALDPLRITVRQVPGRGRPAEHRSRDRGSGLEFADFRNYVPGDDLRRVDWNVYRRSGRLLMRLFEQPEDLAVYVLVDVSASMFFETPPRADAACQVAGALAAVALNQLDRVDVYPCGAELGAPLRAVRGKAGLRDLLDQLEALGPAGPTGLARALRTFGHKRLRPGLLVIVSDFFDPQGVEAVLAALRGVRQRLLLVQLVIPTDAAPELSGEYQLVDCETGSQVDVVLSPRVLARYQAAYARFNDALRGFVVRRGAAHVRIDAHEPVSAQLRTLFPNGVLAI